MTIEPVGIETATLVSRYGVPFYVMPNPEGSNAVAVWRITSEGLILRVLYVRLGRTHYFAEDGEMAHGRA